MPKPQSGKIAVVKVAPLSGGSRVKPAANTFKKFRGTTGGLQITGTDTQTNEYFDGSAAALWADGAVTGKAATFPLAGNLYTSGEEGEAYDILDAAGRGDGEIWVTVQPLGVGAGKPEENFVASITDWQPFNFDASGLVTIQGTLIVRGEPVNSAQT